MNKNRKLLININKKKNKLNKMLKKNIICWKNYIKNKITPQNKKLKN